MSNNNLPLNMKMRRYCSVVKKNEENNNKIYFRFANLSGESYTKETKKSATPNLLLSIIDISPKNIASIPSISRALLL